MTTNSLKGSLIETRESAEVEGEKKDRKETEETETSQDKQTSEVKQGHEESSHVNDTGEEAKEQEEREEAKDGKGTENVTVVAKSAKARPADPPKTSEEETIELFDEDSENRNSQNRDSRPRGRAKAAKRGKSSKKRRNRSKSPAPFPRKPVLQTQTVDVATCDKQSHQSFSKSFLKIAVAFFLFTAFLLYHQNQRPLKRQGVNVDEALNRSVQEALQELEPEQEQNTQVEVGHTSSGEENAAVRQAEIEQDDEPDVREERPAEENEQKEQRIDGDREVWDYEIVEAKIIHTGYIKAFLSYFVRFPSDALAESLDKSSSIKSRSTESCWLIQSGARGNLTLRFKECMSLDSTSVRVTYHKDYSAAEDLHTTALQLTSSQDKTCMLGARVSVLAPQGLPNHGTCVQSVFLELQNEKID